jgi:flagellar biosynthesis/type III secretory pathway protein FliH
MKWSNSISLQQPLADVRLLTKAPAQDWQEHLRDREKTAYDQGRQEGEQSLSEQLVKQRNEMAELQNGVINSLQQMLPKMILEMEAALIQLALEAAKKLVAGLEIKVETVEAVVREALKQVQDMSEISIRLHPEDLALLRQHQSPLLEGLPETGPLRFTASTEVTRGGCIIQTRFGLVDALRETKLEQLRKAVGL